MDDFALIVLERTLELATEKMPPNEKPGVAECVEVIRRYVKLIITEANSDSERKLLQEAVTKLLDIADRNHEFVIALRLKPIARQLLESARAGAA